MVPIIPYLPWIALAIAFIAVLARDGISGRADKTRLEVPAGAFIVLVLLVGFAMFAGWKWPEFGSGALPAVTGFGIGALLAAVSYGLGLLPGQVNAGRSAPMALAAAAVAFATWYGDKASLALVFGAAVAGWLLSLGKSDEPNPWAMRSAIFAATIVAVNQFGSKFLASASGPSLGIVLALAGSLAAIIAGFAGGSLTKKMSSVGQASSVTGIVGMLLWTGAVFLVLRKESIETNSALVVFGGAGVIALIVSWLIPNDTEFSSVRVVIASVMWVAAGTASFGLQRSFGMALALMSGAGTLLILGNRKALLSLGPLGAIVFYRVFREAHTDTAQAFDIGQHYAMIGVMLGAMLPVIAQEWLRASAKRASAGTLFAGALWIVLLAGAPVPIAITLSDKGIIGYLVGLGFASVFEGARGERSAHSLALSLGLGGAMTLLYDWLAPHLNLDRHGKLLALGWIIGIAIVCGILIAILGGDLKRERTTTVGGQA